MVCLFFVIKGGNIGGVSEKEIVFKDSTQRHKGAEFNF